MNLRITIHVLNIYNRLVLKRPLTSTDQAELSLYSGTPSIQTTQRTRCSIERVFLH